MHIFRSLPNPLTAQSKRFSTLWKNLISRLKKSYTYEEKSAVARYLYILTLMALIVFLDIENFVFVDECGVQNDFRRGRARAKRGIRVHGTRPGKKPKRTNVVAGLWGRKHVAVRCYSHTTTSVFFEDWFEWELLSVIPKGSVIIMDNASFHRKKPLMAIAARYGAYLLFLPAYSPDLNKIEPSWANLKRWLTDNYRRFFSLDFAIEQYFGV